MADTELHSHETPEEVLESEIEDLERRTLNSGWLWTAAAFALIVLFSSAFLITNWDRNQASAKPVAIIPEAMLLHEPLGTVDRNVTFRWDPVERAASYILVVTNHDQEEVVLLRPVREKFLKPSETEASNFNSGTYSWTVEARSPKGQLIGYGEGTFTIPPGQ